MFILTCFSYEIDFNVASYTAIHGNVKILNYNARWSNLKQYVCLNSCKKTYDFFKSFPFYADMQEINETKFQQNFPETKSWQSTSGPKTNVLALFRLFL